MDRCASCPALTLVVVLAAAAACSSSAPPGGFGNPDGGDTGDTGTSPGSGDPDSSGGSMSSEDGSSGSRPADGATNAEGGGAPGSDGAVSADAQGCGEFAGDPRPTCSGDGNSLGACVGGVPTIQSCPNGCLHEPAPQPSVCMGTTATNWSCTGAYGTTAVDDGNYYLTSFGCYVDASGNVQTDPGDNCIPSCLSKALSAGLCPAGSSGPECEEAINWFTADGARFGCLARLRVTNPANGKAVIAVALDYGPGCPGENGVSHAVLDASGRIDDYLFGGPEGASDRATVHVVQVDDATPLGPL